ncbi:MAG: DoxX family protein [Flavihumibacter sp.]|nr:DoxX family protein [Flavihumibacter sp.]
MKQLLKLAFIPVNIDVALLTLRVWLGIGLFLNHGVEKVVNFSAMQQHFPNPIGIGSTASLVAALIADAICAVFIIAGLFTRFAALICTLNLFVAFAFLFRFSIAKPPGEIAFIYLGGFIAVLLAGAGKFSFDNKLK